VLGYVGSRLPDIIAIILIVEDVASVHAAAILKLAVLLCWSASANPSADFACLRASSLASPVAGDY
jgi:hypothetical protein